MTDISILKEDESTVQLILVEILTRTEDVDDETLPSHEEDFARVTGYLLSHSTSSIIVKLACQTLEKVSI
jgi:hypothetical protein